MSSPLGTFWPASPGARAGSVVTYLVSAFLLMDAVMKLLRLQVVLDTQTALGWPEGAALPLGLILLISTLLYLVPRTAVLGAVLVTAYLGGAIATQARIGAPLFSHTLFGVYLGLFLWLGAWLRCPRLRAILPLR